MTDFLENYFLISEEKSKTENAVAFSENLANMELDARGLDMARISAFRLSLSYP